MKKAILIGLVLLMMISSVSALNLVTGEDYTIFGTCILLNGSLGGDNMTFTAYYPNSTIFLDEVLMSNYATGYFNYTFLVPNTTGSYPYSMTCSQDGVQFSNSDQFEVFDSSVKDYIEVTNNISQDSASGLSMFLPLFLSIIFLIGAITFNSENHGALKIGLYLASIPPLFSALNIAAVAISESNPSSELVTLLANTTNWIGWLYYVIIGYFCIYLIVMIFKYLHKRKMDRVKY